MQVVSKEVRISEAWQIAPYPQILLSSHFKGASSVLGTMQNDSFLKDSHS